MHERRETMILANVRTQLGRRDAQLAVHLIARGSARELDAAEARLSEQGMDALLDDMRLYRGLVELQQGRHASWPLLVYVFVRHALLARGEENRLLADYVASVLLQFGLRGRARRLTDHDDETYDALTDIATAIEGHDATRSFLARAHLGNYALWVSGMFPDFIEQRRWRRGGPDLGYFEALGSRGFHLAADHRLAREHGLDALYSTAADRFTSLRRALNTVSDRHLFPHVHTPERLMRQVRDGFGDLSH
jgi:hypothetical protein